MEIVFKTKNPKQLLASEAWIDNTTEEILYGGGKGGGKLLTLDTPIPTPSGFIKNGDIKIGDTVFSEDGQQVRVIGTTGIEYENAYRLYFSDGTSIIAGERHLWKTMTFVDRRNAEKRTPGYRENRRLTRKSKSKGLKDWLGKLNSQREYEYKIPPTGSIRTTKEIVDSLLVKGGANHSIQQHLPIVLQDKELLIPPYTLGAWLGDGTSMNSGITGIDKDIFTEIEKDGFVVTHHKSIKSHNINGLVTLTRENGLMGNKHIPLIYLRSSIEQRLALIQGLMDTDGWADKDGSCFITLKSKVLFDGFVELLRTMGIVVITNQVRKMCYNSPTKAVGTYYKATFTSPLPLFRLNRKLIRQNRNPHIRYSRRFIVKAESFSMTPMRCIQVSRADGMYLAGEQFIPTHNSYLGASLIFGDALIYPETHYFIARKELNDLRKYTIPTIYEVFKNWGIKLEDYAIFNGQDNVFYLKNGSKVFLISCSDVPSDPMFERFGSMQNTRGWLEEAGEIPEAAKSNLWLTIGRWKNDVYGLKKKLLITANPKKGWMKSDFVDPFKLGTLPLNRKYIQALATDNKYLPDDYLGSLRNEKDKVRRQRLWEGNWDYDENQDSLLNNDSISDAFSNTIIKDNNKYLVVDVARFGEDSTNISFWDGLELTRVERFNKQDTEATKQKIRDFAAADKIPYSHILIDEDGIGGGVVDGLFGVRGFIANSTPLPTHSQIRSKFKVVEAYLAPKTNFKNLKSQCAFKVAELLNEHRIAFRVPQYRDLIIEDLTALLRHKDPESDGKLTIKPKDEVKQDIGHSPDLGDTIIMRAWFELQKEASGTADPEMSMVMGRQKDNLQRNVARQEMNSAM